MKVKIALVLTVVLMLSCNFLFPTPVAPTEQTEEPVQVTTPSGPQLYEDSSTDTGYAVVRLHPSDGDVHSLLAAQAEKASELGMIPVVEFDADWCPPCQVINKALDAKNKLMLKAYDGVYIIKLNVDEWGWGVDGFAVNAIPVYFKLDSQGQPTGQVIDGGAWGEDIPENIAPVMDEFFHTN